MLPFSLPLGSAALPIDEVVRAAPTAAVLPAIDLIAVRRENIVFIKKRKQLNEMNIGRQLWNFRPALELGQH